MSTTEERLRKIVMDKLGVTADKVVAETKLVEDLGADSLDEVEIVMEIEDEFNLEIPDEDAANLKTFGAALEYVTKKVGA